MKHIAIIIASLLFSILFYNKSIGLNLSMFSLITIVILVIYNSEKFKSKTLLLHAFAYALSAIFVFVNHSSLAIIANCAAFFTLVGTVSQSSTSIYVQWFNGIYTTVAGFFHRNFETNEAAQKVDWKKDVDYAHWAKLIGIPLIFSIVFILLYKNGNPIFNDLISKINFDFINIQWVLFTVLGYFLFSNILNPVVVEPATSKDLQTTNELQQTATFSVEKLKKEKQLGTTLLALLNVLLAFYIVTDLMSLSSIETSKASELSNHVHSGINTLIASIIIAIGIILYFFRGNLNFYAENRILKNIAFSWICLNVILIVLIAIKNHIYITSFGLTYKRIGVHIYIVLTLIGLITTFLKVLKIKNLAFLFRRNTQIAFVVLLLCSTINWDAIITTYNLKNADDYDIDYLINLSNRNAIILYELRDDIEISQHNKNRIETKYQNHILNLSQQKWQELSYETVTNAHVNNPKTH
ncbi:DUF4153 domain-containing protein [Psychroserpens damuponensis]|uniref:DUF4153 domain-containing protein n=1 Tax=Psychroserpens damuponensis TaxID=943936 RepID=UPI00058B1409|nr:DUF4173 domain-containing protein [Psychroserpens damuponensis]